MKKSTLKCASKLAVIILCILGLIELGLALWTIIDRRYRSLAYNLADVGYIDLWILRYLSLGLLASSIITLVMALMLIWGLYSTHAFLFIASTMIGIILIGEFTISILTFTSKYQTRLTLIEQLPKLVITYRQGTDERARRALDILQSTFRCCGADGRLSYQNNVPLSCNMYSIGCLTRTIYFLDACMDVIASILLFFSLIKLVIVLFFYSFLCLYHQHRQNRLKKNDRFVDDSSRWRHSSSFDSISGDNPRQKTLSTDQDENDLSNTYDVSLPNTSTRNLPTSYNNNRPIIYYERPHTSRKLSAISEKTEKTETDDSEPDLSRVRYYTPKRKIINTPVHQNTKPTSLPIIKTRRTLLRDDDYENDSGVEYSSSEKSYDESNIPKQHFEVFDMIPKSKQKVTTSPSPLSFSRVFVTSVADMPTDDEEIRKPLTTSSAFTEPFYTTEIVTPKSILKKTTQHPIQSNNYLQKKLTSPLLQNNPKINPRTSLKQHESLL